MIGKWLFGCAGLTLGMVGVGGMTRLTESGLSITEWKPVTGALPPLSRTAWEDEFARYRESPEFARLRTASFSLDDFKRIYYWEWGHRFMGRVLGLAFVGPWLYFVARGQLRGRLAWQTAAVAALGGAQGAIGWWMVRSGLDKDKGGMVSHHRLTVHLGSALVIYSSLIWLGLNVVTQGKALAATAAPSRALLFLPVPLVFGTALTGAQVAGLDAGLVYGHTLIIPADERERDYSARKQWHHRVMGVTTTLSMWALYAVCRKQALLPPRTMRFAGALAIMATVQAALGITTLWTLVKKEWASAHQIGSVLLLTAALHFSHDIRRILRRRV